MKGLMFSKSVPTLQQELTAAQQALLDAFRHNNTKKVDELAAKIESIKSALRSAAAHSPAHR